MNGEKLFDISTVCEMLGTTSRTLRFYEEKGLISSTKVDFSNRRQYTKEQVEKIKIIFTLRKLGLSLKTISDMQNSNLTPMQAVVARKSEIYEILAAKKREMNLLNEAILAIENGEDIFSLDFLSVIKQRSQRRIQIVKECTTAIVYKDTETLYSHLSDSIKAKQPIVEYEKIMEKMFCGFGNFVSFGKIQFDRIFPDVIYHSANYQNMKLTIKYIFRGDIVSGYWMDYDECKVNDEKEGIR